MFLSRSKQSQTLEERLTNSKHHKSETDLLNASIVPIVQSQNPGDSNSHRSIVEDIQAQRDN